MPSGHDLVAAYQRARAAASRRRKAPDKSITLMPASTSIGAISADAASGKREKDRVGLANQLSRIQWNDGSVPDPRQRRQGGAACWSLARRWRR